MVSKTKGGKKMITIKTHKKIGNALCEAYDNTRSTKLKMAINDFRSIMDEDLFRSYGLKKKNLIYVYYNDKKSLSILRKYKKNK